MNREEILKEVEKTHKRGSQVWGLIKHVLYNKSFSIRQISEKPFCFNAPNKIKQKVMNYFDLHKDLGYVLAEEWTINPITKTRFKEFWLKESEVNQ